VQWLIDVLVKFFGSYFSMWLEKKKAERLEVKLKKREIADKVSKIEDEIEAKSSSKAGDRHLNPAIWNRSISEKSQQICTRDYTPVILFVLVMFTGCCSTKYIESKWPMVKTAERPTISETPDFSNRERKLAGYALSLEAAINAYNKAARKHNEEHGYGD